MGALGGALGGGFAGGAGGSAIRIKPDPLYTFDVDEEARKAFANMFMVMGPHTVLGDIPRGIEYDVDWVVGMIGLWSERGPTRAEAPRRARADHVGGQGEGLPASEGESWMTGIDQNVDGKQTRSMVRHGGARRALPLTRRRGGGGRRRGTPAGLGFSRPATRRPPAGGRRCGRGPGDPR